MEYMEEFWNDSLLGDLVALKAIKLGKEWAVPKGLPRLLVNTYRFKEADFQGFNFILAEDIASDIEVKKILAHRDLLKKATNLPILFAFHELKAHQQKALIASRVNHIDLLGNLYFPDGLLALKAPKEKEIAPPVHLSTWCKVAVIRQIVRGDLQLLTISELAEKFDMSKMHASRFVDELKALSLVQVLKEGTSKRVQFLPKEQLWVKTEKQLGSPIVKKVYLSTKIPKALAAGYTALGESTMLDAGEVLTQAIGKKNFLKIEKQLKPVPKEFSKVCLEVWEWAPENISTSIVVDSISLYLSMKDHVDDRTQIALKEVLNKEIGDL